MSILYALYDDNYNFRRQNMYSINICNCIYLISESRESLGNIPERLGNPDSLCLREPFLFSADRTSVQLLGEPALRLLHILPCKLCLVDDAVQLDERIVTFNCFPFRVYPLPFNPLLVIYLLTLRILPRDDTSYLFSYPAIGFQISSISYCFYRLFYKFKCRAAILLLRSEF